MVNFMRHNKRQVKVGNVYLGGDNPILVQSMLNVKSKDVQGNVRQAVALEKEGCQIVRVSVPTLEDVRLIEAIKKEVKIPLVADIHFDHRIAIAAVEAGIDKVRINPGNIGDDDRVRQVVKACQAHNVPIRIGVNAGSLEKDILAKYGAPTPDALCESAMYHIRLLEKFDCLCSGHDVPHGKPEPDIYLHGAASVGLAPSECLAIEDSHAGVLSASCAGCLTVLIPDLDEPAPETLEPVYACCEKLLDILEYL